MKTCRTCGILKPLESFSRAKEGRGERASRGSFGRDAHCKFCKAEKRKPGIHREREEVKTLAAQGKKRCTKCSEALDASEFNARKASPDGLMQKCRACCKIYATSYREGNPSCFKDYYAQRKDELNANFKKWRKENAGSRTEYMRAWGQENSALVIEKGSRRRAKKLKATPKWANREKMVEFYKEAERLTAETGVIHHVDHIYPLQSKHVCGLHCEFNLNVITQFENIQKLNRMPTEEYLQRCKR